MQDLSKGGATTFFWWLLSCEVVASGRFVWLLFKFFNFIYIYIYLFIYFIYYYHVLVPAGKGVWLLMMVHEIFLAVHFGGDR